MKVLITGAAGFIGSALALRLLERGSVAVIQLVQARYPLSQALAAFERAAQPGTLKVLIDVEP